MIIPMELPSLDLPVPQQLACTEFSNCSSFGSDGTEFTGDNGFTVTDPNHPDSSWSSPSQLACSEFTGCSSFGGDGTEFTGDNGYTVTDPNHPDSSWSVPSQLSQTQALGTYTGPDGTVYTGNGQFTVTDSYTCNQTPCGSFTVQDPTMTTELAPAAPLPTPAADAEQGKAVRATPAHLVMTMHALTFGFLSATAKVVQGESKGWAQDVREDAHEAAATVTPVGAYLLR